MRIRLEGCHKGFAATLPQPCERQFKMAYITEYEAGDDPVWSDHGSTQFVVLILTKKETNGEEYSNDGDGDEQIQLHSIDFYCDKGAPPIFQMTLGTRNSAWTEMQADDPMHLIAMLPEHLQDRATVAVTAFMRSDVYEGIRAGTMQPPYTTQEPHQTPSPRFLDHGARCVLSALHGAPTGPIIPSSGGGG